MGTSFYKARYLLLAPSFSNFSKIKITSIIFFTVICTDLNVDFVDRCKHVRARVPKTASSFSSIRTVSVCNPRNRDLNESNNNNNYLTAGRDDDLIT